jgi:hypothetical protein
LIPVMVTLRTSSRASAGPSGRSDGAADAAGALNTSPAAAARTAITALRVVVADGMRLSLHDPGRTPAVDRPEPDRYKPAKDTLSVSSRLVNTPIRTVTGDPS